MNEDYLSTTMLSRLLQLKGSDVFQLLESNGWITREDNNWVLLPKGKIKGAVYKKSEKDDGQWIVWPESIINDSLFQGEISGEVQLVKRRFELPGVDDLNKDQDKVLRLPEDGQFLIVGGPGTGKSVVALLRAKRYHKNNDYAFLTFNKVLLQATKQLVDFDINSFTLDSWLGKQYWKVFEDYAPNNVSEDMRVDYDSIISNLNDKDIGSKSFHIIVDEGQDKSVKYYESLMCFGVLNLFIVADQNQHQGSPKDRSSRKGLTDMLDLEVDDVIELTVNYRNSHPIAKLSCCFYTDISSPLIDLPPTEKQGSDKPTPILYEYNNFENCVKRILRESDRDNRKLIGVVVANNDLREDYVNSLENIAINLDNARPMISTYSSEDKKAPNINFAYSGIVVLNDKSIKGLEFDIVFIITDGFKIYSNDRVSLKKRFYVMSSRARDKLFFIKKESSDNGVLDILPNDENILIRKRL